MNLNLCRTLILAVYCLGLPVWSGTDFVINIVDPPNVGYNDMTPVTPVGGNTGTTLGEQRLIVLQEALDIIGARLESNVPVMVQATFAPQTCSQGGAVLAGAGSIQLMADFSGAPYPATWYHSALANKIAGFDLNPGPPDPGFRQPPFNDDLFVIANSNLDSDPACLGGQGWYYGLDHQETTGVDLLATLIHELNHGLGFSNFINEQTGEMSSGLPDVFARNTLDLSTGKRWHEMTDGERAASAVNDPNLVWAGPNVRQSAEVLLDPLPEITVVAPLSASGTFPGSGASFGAPIPEGGLTGGLVLVADSGGPPTDACQPLNNGSQVAGQFALVDRGNCSFVEKATQAQNAGAIGVIVANNTGNGFPPLGGQSDSILIPVVGITQSLGDILKTSLPDVTITLSASTTERQGTNQGWLRLHAPSFLLLGSSVSHWAPEATPNLLMEPAINEDLGDTRDVLDLTIAALEDVGWAYCTDFRIEAVLGGPITVRGTPGCLFDLYDTNGSLDPADWTLLASGVRLGPSGEVILDIILEPDRTYRATAAGFPDQPLPNSLLQSVPTLTDLGLLALILATLSLGIYFLRAGKR